MRKNPNSREKTYNRCLDCHHRESKSCNGPRTSAMELQRWCEFMRDLKDTHGLTNAEISEKADVSLKTIERLMALTYDKDILRDTARRIEDAIIGSSNQYPCYLAYEEARAHEVLPEGEQRKVDYLLQLIARLQQENDNLWEENKRKSKLIDSLLAQR